MNLLKKLKKLLMPACLLVAMSTLAFSQDYNTDGIHPEAATFKEVNLQNLGINLHIPIISKAGVGVPFYAEISFNNNFYTSSRQAPLGPNWQSMGWTFAGSQTGFFLATNLSPCGDGTKTVTEYTGYQDASGIFHSLALPVYVHVGGGQVPPCSTVDHTSVILPDGSGLTLNLNASSPSTVTTASGTIITPLLFHGNTSETDVNGNSVTSVVSGPNSTYTDTLGVQELIAPALSVDLAGTGVPFDMAYTYPTSMGTGSVTIVCKKYNIFVNFYQNYSAQGVSLVDHIVLADGSTYKFMYESQSPNTVTGRLSSVTFPNGSTVGYQYFGANNGLLPDGSVPGLIRTDAEGTWTFTRDTTALTTTAVSPIQAANKTVYTFNGNSGGVFPAFLTQTQVYQGGTNLLKTTVICYNGVLTNCVNNHSVFQPILQKDVYTTLAGMSTSSRTSETYDTYGNVTNSAVYDFGATTPTRQYVYSNFGKSWNGTSCVSIGNGVNNAPCQVQLKDGTGTQLRNAYFTYGTSTNPGSLLSVSELVSGSNYLTLSNTYNANGTVATATDANGNISTFVNGACNGGMVSSATIWPIVGTKSLKSSLTWDDGCEGAVIVEVLDANNQRTDAQYNDPFWRTTSVTDEEHNSRSFTYTPKTVESIFKFQASTVDSFHQINPDSLTDYSQTVEGPSSPNWDTVESGYFWNNTGIVNFTTIPCITTKGNGCSSKKTTVTHDAIGRPLLVTDGGGGTLANTYTKQDVLSVLGPAPAGEVVKKMQKEFNGLGQLVSDCQLTSGAGSTSCNQALGGRGFLTTYTYNADGTLASVSKNSSTNTQTQSFTYDDLGRTLTEAYPESGTKRYFFDVAPASPGVACSATTFQGQLVKTYDANGTTACYTYDGINRVTSITYSGPNADGYNKYFVYDSAKVNGTMMPNAAGRIAEAYTAVSKTSRKITDEGFGYTARGELSDTYELTPNSGGYYHIRTTYYANGEVNSVSGITNGPWTYSLDGKGRLSGVSQDTNIALISNVTYNAADQPLVISLGNGDKDQYTYDPNTNRTVGYSFTVGATPKTDSAVLTWNDNGSLRTLQITDNINPTVGTQTCHYGDASTPGYDELGRLISVDCGKSVWQQNFSYDAFNNLTKSVPAGATGTAWNPGYDQNNNQYTLGGTNYDNNGNLLTDTFHTYTWNQDNKLLTVVDSGVALIHDAFGHSVETQKGTVNTQTLISPIGNLGLMNGAEVLQNRTPLPGGLTVVNGNGTNFWHKDWLGSVRLMSTLSGRKATVDRAFAPYGEVYANASSTTNINFTGDNQDLISSLFDTPSRELDPTQGRWISPDPLHTGNSYAYSTDPLRETDTSGLDDTPNTADPGSQANDPSGELDYYFNGGGCTSDEGDDCAVSPNVSEENSQTSDEEGSGSSSSGGSGGGFDSGPSDSVDPFQSGIDAIASGVVNIANAADKVVNGHPTPYNYQGHSYPVTLGIVNPTGGFGGGINWEYRSLQGTTLKEAMMTRFQRLSQIGQNTVVNQAYKAGFPLGNAKLPLTGEVVYIGPAGHSIERIAEDAYKANLLEKYTAHFPGTAITMPQEIDNMVSNAMLENITYMLNTVSTTDPEVQILLNLNNKGKIFVIAP